MILGREELIYFEDLAKLQVQIYPDAADRGILVDGSDGTGGTVKKIEIKGHLLDLMNTVGKENVEIDKDPGRAYENGTVTCSIPVEHSEVEPSKIEYIDVKVGHMVCYKKEFFTIDFARVTK